MEQTSSSTTTSNTNATMNQLRQRSKWMRILYMILFLIAYGITEFILTGIVIVQIILNLLTGDINPRLRGFSNDLSRYIYDILRFLTFNTEEKPFPLADWKQADSTGKADTTSAQ
ncbi:MAG: DUF4389 domain-containing protein [Thiolinea sp.]